MKIGIDLKPFFTGSKYRGIGVYARELITELLQKDAENEYHFLNMYGEYENDPKTNKQCCIHNYFTGPSYVDVGQRQLLRDERTEEVLEAQTAHFLQQSEIDVMLFTSPNEYGGMFKAKWFEGIFKVGILYDLIPLIFPEQCLYDETYSVDYNRSIEFLKGMDLLLAISKSAKEDAVRLLGIPEEKIIVVYAGIDEEFKKLKNINKEKIKEDYKIKDKFILFAGGIDFKKNIEGVIKAFSKADKNITKNYQLIIAGKAAPDLIAHYMNEAAQAGLEEKVSCTGFISKEDLISLYNMAEALIFPSLYEGFGLPVIEAMACGTKVITSNCSSLKEIAEGHAVLVDPRSIKSLTKGIEYTLENAEKLQEKAERSIEYAKSFNWKRTSALVYDAIKENYKENKSELKIKTFQITEELLHNISTLYGEKGLEFKAEDMNKIALELLKIVQNRPNRVWSGKYRILFDLTVVHEWLKAGYVTGIGRVSSELYKALSEITDTVPIIISTKGKTPIYSRISMKTYEVEEENLELAAGDIYFMPELQLRGIQVKKDHPFAKELQKKGIKCYAVIHDILPIRFPQYFEAKTGAEFDSYVRELVTNYHGIFGVSKTVSEDVAAYCREKDIFNSQNEVKLGYFHHGKNSFEETAIGKSSYTLKKFIEDKEYVFLMVGTIEPRKGHENILKVFEQRWKKGSNDNLCIIGRQGWNMEQFVQKVKTHPQLGDKLIFLEGASDQEVAYAYKHCSGLIQAAAGEGFGLPLIEAGNYNLPILCSDIPVFHEVAGENALYFNRDDLQSIEMCIEDFKKRKHEGVLPQSANIRLLDWSDTAQRIYDMVVEGTDWNEVIKTNGEIISYDS
jgi:Glycosyltransferase